MILSYLEKGGNQVRPEVCACGQKDFHGHGSYWRLVAQEWVLRFLCTHCRRTTSLIPASCVPYKHHRTELINSVVHDLLNGASKRAFHTKGIAFSTGRRWLSGFCMHASVLATEGAERLGIKAFSGPPKRIYKQLREQFPEQPESNFFSDLQVKLCAKLPALGLFRVLIF